MISLRLILNLAMAAPGHPILPNDEPVGLLSQGIWLNNAEDAVEMRPFQHSVAGALQTEDGQTVVIQDGLAISYSELGCEGSEIDIDGVAHAIAPTADGFAGYILSEIEGDDNNWFLHQNLGSSTSWPAIRQFSAIEADLQATALGWMILKETTVGWTLEHSYSDGGTPSPYPIPLEGQLSLLDATDSEALIQSRRLIQSDKVKGEISVERALYHWEINSGLTLLDARTDGQFWTQGVLGHSHGIYVLTDQGVVENHINGFIVDNGEAACIWKNKNSDSIWLCQPSSGESEYTFWQSIDGIQWTGRLASEPQVTYECPNGDPSSAEDPPSKGCQSLPQGRKPMLLILLGCVALTTRNNRDSGALSSQ